MIPRWRSPLVVDGWEIAAARDLGNVPLTADLFADQLALWRKEATVAAAVDIYDTGILLSDEKLQLEGAGPILSNAKSVPPALLEDVRRSFARSEDLQSRRHRLSRLETNQAYLRSTIRLLKRRIINHPRDVLALLELSRLYVLSGQPASAERYVRQAIALAPNNRLVLRSATQFYKLVGDLGDVLPALRDSEAAKYDPLLQSTEIAAADLAGRGSRFAASALRSLKGVQEVGVQRSELALAVATVEHAAGLPQRRVFQMVKAGLARGTENAQAQAVWLGEQNSRSLEKLLPNLVLSDNAFEAKALALFEAEDYAGAAREARAWLADQPFEPDAISMVCNCHAIYLRSADVALSVANHGFELHPDNWTVQNAILLVYVRARKLKLASVALSNLTRLANTPAIQAFSLAGAGLLAFAQRDFPSGRLFYERAIYAAREAKRPDLVYSAAVFWVHAEGSAGIISVEVLASLDDVITKSAKRLPPSNRDYASKLWKVVKQECIEMLQATPQVSDAHPSVPLDKVLGSLPDQLLLE